MLNINIEQELDNIHDIAQTITDKKKINKKQTKIIFDLLSNYEKLIETLKPKKQTIEIKFMKGDTYICPK